MEWKPPVDTTDLVRLNKLVAYYESVNLDQIQQISNLKQTHEANAKTILDYEKNKKILTKTIKSLEGRMKFDKIAADGMKKKFNLLEFEVRDLKLSNYQMSSERSEDKTMILQLKDDLNNNRSDKLKFMHENANLKKQLSSLTMSETNASSDAVFARGDLLEKLQLLDNVTSANETLKRTISAQSEEMLTLSHEQYDLNEKLFSANKQVVTLELMTAEYNRTIDILQHEISRLRKELASSSHSFNVKSTALLTRGGSSNPANKVSTSITNSTYNGSNEDGPYALARRPHTQHTLSRERNQLASAGDSGVFSGTQSAGFRSSSRSQPRVKTSSTSNDSGLPHVHKEYSYVDLSAHLTRPVSSSGSSGGVLVAGGSISTAGSLSTTVRSHLLQGYSDVMEQSNHDLHSRSSADVKASAANNGYTAMCSPVSTPFRPPPGQSPLKPLTAQHGQLARSSGGTSSGITDMQHRNLSSWFEKGPQTNSQEGRSAHMVESLSSIKKCYSMSDHCKAKNAAGTKDKNTARAATTSGRQEGVQVNNFSSSGIHDDDMRLKTASSDAGDDTGGGGASPARVSFHPSDPPLANFKSTNVNSTKINNKASKQAPPETGDRKSLFVGAGLGLKHNLELDAELSNLNKGSTHSKLKKILGDRFD